MCSVPESTNRNMSYDSQSLLQKWNDELAALFIPLDVIFGLFIIVGFFGNSLVVFIYKFRMKGNMKDRYFIPVLAVMDALVCVLGPTISMVLSIYPVKSFGNILCKILIFIFRIPLIASVLLTFVIGCFRFRKVCVSKSSTMTMRKCRLAVFLTIIISLILASPVLFFYGEVPLTKTLFYGNITVNVTGCRCGLRTEESAVVAITLQVYLAISLITVVVVVISLIVFYSCIGRKMYVQSKKIERSRSVTSQSSFENDSHSSSIKRFSRNRSASTKSQDSNKISLSLTFGRRSEKVVGGPNSPFEDRPPFQFKSKKTVAKSLSRRYTWLFMAISTFFIVSYIPTLVTNLLIKWDTPQFWQDFDNAEIQGYTYILFTYLSNHVVNPFFYAYFDSSFRQRTVQTFKCW